MIKMLRTLNYGELPIMKKAGAGDECLDTIELAGDGYAEIYKDFYQRYYAVIIEE